MKKKDKNGQPLPEHNWVWSPQGVINMHYPERWGYLQFTRQAKAPAFELPTSELRRRYLWLVYYRQQEYREKNGRYASSLAELNITPQVAVAQQANQLQLQATPLQFMATLTAPDAATLRINDEGLVETVKR